MMYDGPGIWGILLGTMSMVLFWALIIVAIVALVRYTATFTRRSDGHAAGPAQLLAERFARGEIDEDEYRRRLQVLGERERPRSES